MWSWGISVYVSTPHESSVFEALAALQNSFSSVKVYIIRGYVAKRFVIPARVVVCTKLPISCSSWSGNSRMIRVIFSLQDR